MEPPSTLIGKRDAPITLVDLLDWRATEDPARTAFVFLRNGETIDRTIDYTTLRTRARAVAAALEGCATQRALLLFAPGLDYVAAFLGCLYAGVVAVPAYPPDPGRIARTLPRLRAMAASSKPTTVLTTSDFLAAAPSFFEQALEFRS
ncbi:MAG TPA: AMP-binding protein, partial [Polyangiaceae bacterium]|nr:AMP-binding protein [Polyangiaceae bacterium]